MVSVTVVTVASATVVMVMGVYSTAEGIPQVKGEPYTHRQEEKGKRKPQTPPDTPRHP